MVAALTHLFGVHNLALAEDVVQDAFCRARDILRRERTARTYAPPRLPKRSARRRSGMISCA